MRAQPKFYLSFKIQAQALTETNKPNRDLTFSVGLGNEGSGLAQPMLHPYAIDQAVKRLGCGLILAGPRKEESCKWVGSK